MLTSPADLFPLIWTDIKIQFNISNDIINNKLLDTLHTLSFARDVVDTISISIPWEIQKCLRRSYNGKQIPKII